MELEITDPVTNPTWDQFIATHPDSTVFHWSGWAKVLSRTYGHKPVYISCSQGKNLLALVPMMEIRSMMTGHRAVCLPFTDLCPPLTYGESETSRLPDRLGELARAQSWKYIELRGRLPGTSMRPTAAFYGHTLELTNGSEAIYRRFTASVRRAIRKAERARLTIRIERRPEAILEFYELHVQTRKRHGLPPQPRAFFQNIQKEIIEPGMGVIVLADWGDRSVAAAVFLTFGKNAIYKYGASDDHYQEMRPNNLVMWHGIQFLAQSGCTTLHFGRTSRQNHGLRNFKMGWGAREELIEYFRFNAASGNCPVATDRSSGLHTMLFRNLPSGLNRLAGAIIYPHLD